MCTHIILRAKIFTGYCDACFYKKVVGTMKQPWEWGKEYRREARRRLKCL